MAFLKSDDFILENGVQPATSVVDGKVIIPLVFTNEEDGFHGFVPGIAIKDVVCKDIKECETKLFATIKPIILEKITNKKPFPFFPENDEIKQDFKNVCFIKRISIKVK